MVMSCRRSAVNPRTPPRAPVAAATLASTSQLPLLISVSIYLVYGVVFYAADSGYSTLSTVLSYSRLTRVVLYIGGRRGGISHLHWDTDASNTSVPAIKGLNSGGERYK